MKVKIKKKKKNKEQVPEHFMLEDFLSVILLSDGVETVMTALPLTSASLAH